MKRTACLGLIHLAIVGGVWAATPVSVTVKPMTFPVERSALGEAPRGGTTAGSGYYPIRDAVTKKPVFVIEDQTVDVVVLDNGLVEAWICPAFGGRLLRAIDKKTNIDYFARRVVDGKWIFDDKLAWNPGGVKASFPFFEHGLGLRIPAGYRTITAPDGSATVAMDMRFTDQNTARELTRYGRYGDEALTILVSLHPGSTLVEWTQRKDNNNATGRSDRMWNDCTYPAPVVKKTVTEKDKQGNEVTKEVADVEAMDKLIEFIYPARWVVDHGPNNVHTSPHWAALKNWGVSHFAIDAPYGFAGGYYTDGDLNRIRINDPRPGFGPGCKLYTAPGSEFFELWGGESWVFEYPGELLPAYKPSTYTHRYWMAQGIGKVSYANAEVAVGVEGTNFHMVASHEAQAEVTDDTGKVVAKGAIGPHQVLQGTFTGKQLAVKLDGKAVMDQTFPLDRPIPAKDTPVEPKAQALFDKLKAGVSTEHPTFYERGCYARNEGQPGLVNAWENFAKVTDAKNPARTASLARVAYRLGELEQAERLAKLVGGPEGDYVLGLVALERGQATDFGSAGWEADYLRALNARKANDLPKAITLVKSYLAHVPDAWYPRLALARWSNDVAAAEALANENPAAPEAQLLLKLMGKPNELDKTIAQRDEVQKHLLIFSAQIERGEYQPLPRFPVDIIRKKGW
jgi:hypothetical protein